MAAVAARDEVQRAAGGRMQRGMDRRAPRQGYRRRRQAVADIRIVRRVNLQILAPDVAVVLLAHGVDHRRIGLQPHALLQTPDEHAGDLVALGRHRRFLFDNGCHDQCLIGTVVRQVRAALLPLLRQRLSHAAIGAAQEIDIGRAAGEMIGIRVEPALGMIVIKLQGSGRRGHQ